MKTLFTLLFASMAVHVNCQIPNGGFENWSNGNPVGWSTSNGQFSPVVQVNHAHEGASAMKMQWQLNGLVGAQAQCPAFDSSGITKFPITGRPTSLDGWYLSSFGSGDFLRVYGELYKNGSPIGFASQNIFGSAANYTSFSIPVTYSASGNADSASVNLTLLYQGAADFSSFVLVDDLTFSTNLTGLKAQSVNSAPDLKLYHHAAFSQVHIEYQCGRGGPVKILVRDLNGKIIKILVDELLPSGIYGLDMDLSDFPQGLYLVEMTGTQVLTEKLVVMKSY